MNICLNSGIGPFDGGLDEEFGVRGLLLVVERGLVVGSKVDVGMRGGRFEGGEVLVDAAQGHLVVWR
jgi:hypothetical protein